MLDFSLGELALIAVVALIVIGPDDLPKAFRSLMQFIKQCQGMVSELRQSVDDLMDESGLKEAHQDIKTIIDQNGIEQEVYDISDLIAVEKRADEPHKLPEPPKP